MAGVTTARETELKGHSIRKVEKHCSSPSLRHVKSGVWGSDVKEAHHRSKGLEFKPQNPHKGRRELTPQICLLTLLCPLWHIHSPNTHNTNT